MLVNLSQRKDQVVKVKGHRPPRVLNVKKLKVYFLVLMKFKILSRPSKRIMSKIKYGSMKILMNFSMSTNHIKVTNKNSGTNVELKNIKNF